jgi:hypothetical protein
MREIFSHFDTTNLISIGVALLLLVALLVRGFFRKLGKNLPNSDPWRTYLKGQFLMLSMFLVIGGGLASLSAYFGPAQGKISKGVQLIPFDKLNPTDKPIYEEINVENYSYITVLTKTTAPPNGSALITIYADQGDATVEKSAVKHFDSVATTWSRWDQQNSSKRISLVVAPPVQPNTASATEVQVLVYLTPK